MELNTSAMKSPPLVVCVVGSWPGAWVSAANCSGPGTAALSVEGLVAGIALAAGAVTAAAPASVAPLRKLRRPMVGELSCDLPWRFDMAASRYFMCLTAQNTAMDDCRKVLRRARRQSRRHRRRSACTTMVAG